MKRNEAINERRLGSPIHKDIPEFAKNWMIVPDLRKDAENTSETEQSNDSDSGSERDLA